MLRSVTKVLYPRTASAFDATPTRVERAIRHAIDATFEKSDPVAVYELFGNSIPTGTGKPTNTHFLATVAHKVRRERLAVTNN